MEDISQYLQLASSRRRLSPAAQLELFKQLESAEADFWTVLLAKIDGTELALLAEVLNNEVEDLIERRVPLDRFRPFTLVSKVLKSTRHFTALSAVYARAVVLCEQIAENNLFLVVSQAKKYKRRGEFTFEDVIQEGNFGLIKAVYRFDWRMGNQFSTYAVNWINHEIGRALMNNADAIRLPVHVHGDKGKMADPMLPRIVSEELVNHDSGQMFSHYDLAADPAPSADEQLELHQLATLLHEFLDELTELQRYIIESRYGLGRPTRTLKEIGDELGYSRERIRQIEVEALGELRRAMKKL